MRGHVQLIDAALQALERLERRQFLSEGSEQHRDIIRQLRRALVACGVSKQELPPSARRRRAASKRTGVFRGDPGTVGESPPELPNV